MFSTFMMSFFLSFSLAHASASQSPAATTPQTFGEVITLKETSSLAGALKSPEQKDILISGQIKKVCEQKGCWMMISEGNAEVRVTFKGYSFFVPKNSAGKNVLAQGRVVEKEESVAQQQHYLKDGGASAEEIAQVTAPKKVKTFVASGLRIQP